MIDSYQALLSHAGRSPDWRAIPEAIEEMRIFGEATTGMNFWRKAAELTGKPELSLRQMCRAYGVVLRFSDHLGRDQTEVALTRHYTWLEVIARLADIHPERAVELLERPWHAPSVRDARRELARARRESGPPQDGLLGGQQRRRDAVAFVALQLNEVSAQSMPGITFVRYAADTPAVSPSLIAISKSGSTARAAALIVGKADRSTVSGAVRQAGWEATFFSTYWLAVPLEADPELERILATYGVGNLGVARFDAAKLQFTTTVQPSTSIPNPDRRSLITIPDRHQR